MGLKGRLQRLEQGVQSEGVILRLRDGGLRIFDRMEIAKEMFLSQMDLMLGKARPPRRRGTRPAAPNKQHNLGPSATWGTGSRIGWLPSRDSRTRFAPRRSCEWFDRCSILPYSWVCSPWGSYRFTWATVPPLVPTASQTT